MALVLAGCGGRQTEELLGSAVVTASIDQISGNHAIFVATTRKRASSLNKVFDGERSATLSYARVNVTVPKIHQTGQIERKSRGASDDPSKYFMASEVVFFQAELAHAHYAAAPEPVWPDAPSAGGTAGIGRSFTS